MCGIAGVIGRDRDRVAEATRRISVAQSHRGPDGDGLEVHQFGGGWIGLGHRRLAFLDLSPLGAQPMDHPPTGCRLVYNGEVYNFARLRADLEREGERFRSGSDTEVLLAGIARHGTGFVERLEGMYAFAVFDPRGPVVVLGRDPAGIKPLYLAEGDGCLVFASEVRAVLASGLIPRTVDRGAIAGLLAYGAVPQPLTLFDRVRMFPAGAVGTIRADGTVWQVAPPRVWWAPPPPEAALPDGEVVARTRDLLAAAVRDHLISDVPVGVFLSAGLDSTAVAGLAAGTAGVRAFTVTVGDQPDFDELAPAVASAKRFGLSHTSIHLPGSAAEAAARDWLAAADQPSMDGLNTFVISRAVRGAGVKAALSGLGADELFGGYPSFREVPRLRRLRRAVGWLPSTARRGVAMGVAIRRPAAQGKLGDLLAGPADVARMTLGRRRLMTDRQLAALGLDRTTLGLTFDWLPPSADALLPPADADPGWSVSVTESLFYQTNVLLRDSDATAMACSLELRVPFLDQRLMNWLHRLPGGVRFPADREPKWLLRAAAADLLDPDLLARPKTGFTLPIRRWMVGPLRSLCEDGLIALKQSELVTSSGVDELWGGFRADPEGPGWSRVLALVALGDYLRRVANVERSK